MDMFHNTQLLNTKQDLLCNQSLSPLRPTNQFSKLTRAASLIHQTVVSCLTTLSLQLAMVQKTALTTTSSETHGDQIGVNKATSELLLMLMDLEFVVFSNHPPSQQPIDDFPHFYRILYMNITSLKLIFIN